MVLNAKEKSKAGMGKGGQRWSHLDEGPGKEVLSHNLWEMREDDSGGTEIK